jgi:hypothetical protein
VTDPVRYCSVCRSSIPLKRIMRASPYCTDKCRLHARSEMRQVKAQKACRLCGRPPLKPRRPKQTLTGPSESASVSAPGNVPERPETFSELNREWQSTIARIPNRSAGISHTSELVRDNSHSGEEPPEVDKTSIN